MTLRPRSLFFPAAILCLLSGASIFSHEHAHPEASPPPPDKIQTIHAAYLRDIKPIFDQKCSDCHGTIRQYPRYYAIPGIKQFIDSDIREAKEHMDFSKDFPFGGHGSPLENLKAIREDTEEGEMPPFLYLLMHRENKLTQEEEARILRWVEDSEKILSP